MKGDLDKRFLCLSRVSAKYTITSLPAKAGQDMGDRAIKKFLEDLKAGRIRLDDAIARYSNEPCWRSSQSAEMRKPVDWTARGTRPSR